jgi:SagB-type dehydrogenase family enzyme
MKTKYLLLVFVILFISCGKSNSKEKKSKKPSKKSDYSMKVESKNMNSETIKLPVPKLNQNISLAEALKLRKSSRNFSTKPFSKQMISNLLWAAFGKNRGEGKRTAPSARNWQEIDIYVSLESGLYLWDYDKNWLKSIIAKDIREDCGIQEFTNNVPINLIYVSDHRKIGDRTKEKKDFYSATDTGFISQNVYLFAASENLATVVLGMVDREKLKKTMKLHKDQYIILTQPVGYRE